MKKKIKKYDITDDKYKAVFFPQGGTGKSYNYEDGNWDLASSGFGQTPRQAMNNAIEKIERAGYDVSQIKLAAPPKGKAKEVNDYHCITIKVKGC